MQVWLQSLSLNPWQSSPGAALQRPVEAANQSSAGHSATRSQIDGRCACAAQPGSSMPPGWLRSSLASANRLLVRRHLHQLARLRTARATRVALHRSQKEQPMATMLLPATSRRPSVDGCSA